MPENADVPRAAVGLEIRVHTVSAEEARLDLGGPATVAGAVAVRVTVRNHTDRAVRMDPDRLVLLVRGGSPTSPLTGAALAAALDGGPGGSAVRTNQLGDRRIAPKTTVTAYLVYPAAEYDEARVSFEDVETGESEGFVAPVD
jgi:hypothetical protein